MEHTNKGGFHHPGEDFDDVPLNPPCPQEHTSGDCGKLKMNIPEAHSGSPAGNTDASFSSGIKITGPISGTMTTKPVSYDDIPTPGKVNNLPFTPPVAEEPMHNPTGHTPVTFNPDSNAEDGKTEGYRPPVATDVPGFNPSSPPGATLTIFDGSSDPQHFELNLFGKPCITFGRDASNDIVIQSKYVSRKHGQIKIFNGKFIIEDLKSANGITFDSNKIPWRELQDGDALRIDDGNSGNAGVLLVFSFKGQEEVWNTYQIMKPDTTIGRDKTCDIVLGHVGVSRLHARIVFQSGAYHIVDNGSTNGTWINGRKITGKYKLNEKDIILITNSKLVFSDGKISFCTFSQGIRVDANHIVKKVDNGKKTICSDVSLSIDPCELIAIVGGSGAGKSTIMNCISGYSQPTYGSVSVNGVDLYTNLDSMRNIIGYVPQQDIVFENLTVYDMLKYTASLRLPKDINEREKNDIILKAIEAVELTKHRNTLIKSLSGGQRKRASIAVELISDPKLFFLDEPCSGLDPGTERNLMYTLKNMASSGKTVIFVTHSTLNLRICDKIIFMGTGGKLCFYGSYDDALKFFGVDDMVDVYDMISTNPDFWNQKYCSTTFAGEAAPAPAKAPRKTSKPDWFHQVAVLSKRHLHLMFNDKFRFLILFAQPLLLALLVSFVANRPSLYTQYEFTKTVVFVLSCTAYWIGISNAIQEICKERTILKREYMTGLRLDSYIISKMFTLGLLCFVQSVIMTTVFAAVVGLPPTGVLLIPYIEFLLTIFLTSYGAAATGLLISALVKNGDSASAIAPFMVLPQMLFSGIIFTLEGVLNSVSWLTTCRFSVESLGTTCNLNALPSKIETVMNAKMAQFSQVYGVPEGMDMSSQVSNMKGDPSSYEFSAVHFLFEMFMLILFIAVFATLAGLVLQKIKKENR